MATTGKAKKVASTVAAVAAAAALMLGGTLAWQSANQTALNEASDVINPGGRLHDDFYIDANGDYNADIYVENFDKEDIFARVQLQEYMEVIMNYGTAGEKNYLVLGEQDEAMDSSSINIRTREIDENTTEQLYEREYATHYAYAPDSSVEQAGADYRDAADPANYWEWTMGSPDSETVYYMPTFNKNKDSLVADRNGMYVDRIGGISNRGADQYEDYTIWQDGDTKTANEIWDADINDIDEVGYLIHEDLTQYIDDKNITTVEATHTAKAVGKTNGFISMTEWLKLKDANADTDNYWVWDDTDENGWIYWSSPIKPDTTTGLLLDSIELKDIMDDTWYYAINVIAQFVTADDVGKSDGTGFYDTEKGSAPTTNAEEFLEDIGVNVSGEAGDDPSVTTDFAVKVSDYITGNSWTINNGSLELTPSAGTAYSLSLVSDSYTADDFTWEITDITADSSSLNPNGDGTYYLNFVADGDNGTYVVVTVTNIEDASKAATLKVTLDQYDEFADPEPDADETDPIVLSVKAEPDWYIPNASNNSIALTAELTENGAPIEMGESPVQWNISAVARAALGEFTQLMDNDDGTAELSIDPTEVNNVLVTASYTHTDGKERTGEILITNGPGVRTIQIFDVDTYQPSNPIYYSPDGGTYNIKAYFFPEYTGAIQPIEDAYSGQAAEILASRVSIFLSEYDTYVPVDSMEGVSFVQDENDKAAASVTIDPGMTGNFDLVFVLEGFGSTAATFYPEGSQPGDDVFVPSAGTITGSKISLYSDSEYISVDEENSILNIYPVNAWVQVDVVLDEASLPEGALWNDMTVTPYEYDYDNDEFVEHDENIVDISTYKVQQKVDILVNDGSEGKYKITAEYYDRDTGELAWQGEVVFTIVVHQGSISADGYDVDIWSKGGNTYTEGGDPVELGVFVYDGEGNEVSFTTEQIAWNIEGDDAGTAYIQNATNEDGYVYGLLYPADANQPLTVTAVYTDGEGVETQADEVLTFNVIFKASDYLTLDGENTSLVHPANQYNLVYTDADGETGYTFEITEGSSVAEISGNVLTIIGDAPEFAEIAIAVKNAYDETVDTIDLSVSHHITFKSVYEGETTILINGSPTHVYAGADYTAWLGNDVQLALGIPEQPEGYGPIYPEMFEEYGVVPEYRGGDENGDIIRYTFNQSGINAKITGTYTYGDDFIIEDDSAVDILWAYSVGIEYSLNDDERTPYDGTTLFLKDGDNLTLYATSFYMDGSESDPQPSEFSWFIGENGNKPSTNEAAFDSLTDGYAQDGPSYSILSVNNMEEDLSYYIRVAADLHNSETVRIIKGDPAIDGPTEVEVDSYTDYGTNTLRDYIFSINADEEYAYFDDWYLVVTPEAEVVIGETYIITATPDGHDGPVLTMDVTIVAADQSNAVMLVDDFEASEEYYGGDYGTAFTLSADITDRYGNEVEASQLEWTAVDNDTGDDITDTVLSDNGDGIYRLDLSGQTGTICVRVENLSENAGNDSYAECSFYYAGQIVTVPSLSHLDMYYIGGTYEPSRNSSGEFVPIISTNRDSAVYLEAYDNNWEICTDRVTWSCSPAGYLDEGDLSQGVVALTNDSFTMSSSVVELTITATDEQGYTADFTVLLYHSGTHELVDTLSRYSGGESGYYHVFHAVDAADNDFCVIRHGRPLPYFMLELTYDGGLTLEDYRYSVCEALRSAYDSFAMDPSVTQHGDVKYVGVCGHPTGANGNYPQEEEPLFSVSNTTKGNILASAVKDGSYVYGAYAGDSIQVTSTRLANSWTVSPEGSEQSSSADNTRARLFFTVPEDAAIGSEIVVTQTDGDESYSITLHVEDPGPLFDVSLNDAEIITDAPANEWGATLSLAGLSGDAEIVVTSTYPTASETSETWEATNNTDSFDVTIINEYSCSFTIPADKVQSVVDTTLSISQPTDNGWWYLYLSVTGAGSDTQQPESLTAVLGNNVEVYKGKSYLLDQLTDEAGAGITINAVSINEAEMAALPTTITTDDSGRYVLNVGAEETHDNLTLSITYTADGGDKELTGSLYLNITEDPSANPRVLCGEDEGGSVTLACGQFATFYFTGLELTNQDVEWFIEAIDENGNVDEDAVFNITYTTDDEVTALVTHNCEEGRCTCDGNAYRVGISYTEAGEYTTLSSECLLYHSGDDSNTLNGLELSGADSIPVQRGVSYPLGNLTYNGEPVTITSADITKAMGPYKPISNVTKDEDGNYTVNIASDEYTSVYLTISYTTENGDTGTATIILALDILESNAPTIAISSTANQYPEGGDLVVTLTAAVTDSEGSDVTLSNGDITWTATNADGDTVECITVTAANTALLETENQTGDITVTAAYGEYSESITITAVPNETGEPSFSVSDATNDILLDSNLSSGDSVGVYPGTDVLLYSTNNSLDWAEASGQYGAESGYSDTSGATGSFYRITVGESASVGDTITVTQTVGGEEYSITLTVIELPPELVEPDGMVKFYDEYDKEIAINGTVAGSSFSAVKMFDSEGRLYQNLTAGDTRYAWRIANAPEVDESWFYEDEGDWDSLRLYIDATASESMILEIQFGVVDMSDSDSHQFLYESPEAYLIYDDTTHEYLGTKYYEGNYYWVFKSIDTDEICVALNTDAYGFAYTYDYAADAASMDDIDWAAVAAKFVGVDDNNNPDEEHKCNHGVTPDVVASLEASYNGTESYPPEEEYNGEIYIDYNMQKAPYGMQLPLRVTAYDSEGQPISDYDNYTVQVSGMGLSQYCEGYAISHDENDPSADYFVNLEGSSSEAGNAVTVSPGGDLAIGAYESAAAGYEGTLLFGKNLDMYYVLTITDNASGVFAVYDVSVYVTVPLPMAITLMDGENELEKDDSGSYVLTAPSGDATASFSIVGGKIAYGGQGYDSTATAYHAHSIDDSIISMLSDDLYSVTTADDTLLMSVDYFTGSVTVHPTDTEYTVLLQVEGKYDVDGDQAPDLAEGYVYLTVKPA